MISGQSKTKFLSPNLLSSLFHHELNPKHNVYKSDVFSLGMLLLQCVTLESPMSCYDLSFCKIRENILNKKLNIIQMKYSNELSCFLRDIL